MVIALAGRRIDAADAAEPRFPLRNVPVVSDRIRTMLTECRGTDLVCSAACGADLLALEAAGDLGMRRRVVLPSGPSRFRDTSVTDRPGDWGDRYDRIIQALEPRGDVVVNPQSDSDYLATNLRILDEAEALAATAGGPVVSVVVWNGGSRGSEDVTEAFATESRRRGHEVREVSTI